MYGDERDPEMREFLHKISPLNNGAHYEWHVSLFINCDKCVHLTIMTDILFFSFCSASHEAAATCGAGQERPARAVRVETLPSTHDCMCSLIFFGQVY